MDLIRVTPNKERAKNILRMILLIEERINTQDKKKMTALIISDYYEIVKELSTILLLLDGYKTLSHKELIGYVKKNYSELNSNELSLLDDLRILRNRVAYEGLFIDYSYLKRNENNFKLLINKIKGLVNQKLK